jgi:hypothetical protein
MPRLRLPGGTAGRHRQRRSLLWATAGLRLVLATRQVAPETPIAAGRVLRRWYRAKGLTKQVTVVRVDQATDRVYYRRSHKRKWLFAHDRGFVTVNDGQFSCRSWRYLSGTEPGAHW